MQGLAAKRNVAKNRLTNWFWWSDLLNCSWLIASYVHFMCTDLNCVCKLVLSLLVASRITCRMTLLNWICGRVLTSRIFCKWLRYGCILAHLDGWVTCNWQLNDCISVSGLQRLLWSPEGNQFFLASQGERSRLNIQCGNDCMSFK